MFRFGFLGVYSVAKLAVTNIVSSFELALDVIVVRPSRQSIRCSAIEPHRKTDRGLHRCRSMLLRSDNSSAQY